MSSAAKAKFDGTVQPWGNSLGIRITRPISALAHLDKGDEVSIEVTDTGIVISRKKPLKQFKLPYSEADLLEGLTPHKAHADELPSILDKEVGV